MMQDAFEGADLRSPQPKDMLPLISSRAMDDVLAWRPCGPVTVLEFLTEARQLAAALLPGPSVLNLCEDRYHFAVLFAACVMTGKVSLQPASHSAETLRQLAQSHPGLFVVSDGEVGSAGLPCMAFPQGEAESPLPLADGSMPMVPADRVVAILFTSGSTGTPQAHEKTWGKLVRNGQAEAVALGLDLNPKVLVGTIPAQHSYGFESTFLLALHGGCSFYSGKPFFAQDVVDALSAVPRPRMLVTTPFHLSTLLDSGLDWPAVDALLCATAPLDTGLAERAEQSSGAALHEIYGSTESGQLAVRRTTAGPIWQLLPGVSLEQDGDFIFACKGHVEGRVALSDYLEIQQDGCFLLHGRHADVINIAGKRSSLVYLNHQLCAIEGVRDGAFFMPDESDAQVVGGVVRLCAFVVAAGFAAAALQQALRERIDQVFMPRPLVFVDELPRSDTGKLPRAALQSLYRSKVQHGRV